MNKKKLFFKTFGCKTNQFDTQIMMQNIPLSNIVDNEQDADIIVVNSCTVTNGADVSTRSYINKYQNKKIIFTGCAAFNNGPKLLKEQKVNIVIGHSQKSKIKNYINKNNIIDLGDLNYIDSTIVTDYIGKSRAFIKIQEGCDFDCSYCIIPSVRGKARSYKLEHILAQIEILANNGYGEFVLTGTNVGSWGKDMGVSIAKALKQISKIRGVKRIRLGSLEPIQIDDEFLEILNEDWMAKHLHIALQHTSDEMLEILNRRNRFKDDMLLFEKIAQNGYSIGSDFIIGHSGESEEVWNKAVDNLKKLPLTHIHPFSYSKRDNTKSALLKNHIKGDITKQRLKQLKDIVANKNYNFRLQKQPLNILIENCKNGLCNGWDQFYNKMQIESDKDIANNWIEIKEYNVLKKYNQYNNR